MTPSSRRQAFQPASLQDPVALTTEWKPCNPGGANFRTRALTQYGPRRVGFRPTLGAVLFCAVFAVLGCALLVGALNATMSANTRAPVGVLSLVGLAFAGGGLVALYLNTRPIVFDRELGRFWKAWRTPRPGVSVGVELTSIHALQVISEYCSGKASFYSYELNLVLTDGSRLNVVDHGDLASIRGDAEALASFLGVPLWDPV
jgi:hypothetical protein